jgi:hypothetical protein
MCKNYLGSLHFTIHPDLKICGDFSQQHRRRAGRVKNKYLQHSFIELSTRGETKRDEQDRNRHSIRISSDINPDFQNPTVVTSVINQQ